MIRVKLRWLWLLLIGGLAISYPISVWAADVAMEALFVAPFLSSWVGVWVFGGAGGVGAGFIIVEEIDVRLKTPRLAKFFIGLFWGVGICLVIHSLTNTPLGALTFFALVASSFATPVTTATMIWAGNQKRVNKALNQAFNKKTGIDTRINEEDE